ncbi:SDR family oxidoreductase [Chelatococcus reniformis]|uniref:Short chain dehydrogenase n=1 Tax=Chelatococcus reniformis TaxID=1494448 RepID=A0A916UPG0_9HYPH|nr:SDR family oxidoreductase [Chelatococcus reniformis]GGC80290.1 short chain dehydrogenase [Chelatococcus reniformis]
MTAAPSHTEVALVTGSAKRIGATVTEALSRAGYGVVIHCHRSRDAAEALAARLTAEGGRCAVAAADLEEAAAAAGLVTVAASLLGPITLLVNSAAIFEPDDITDFDVALWDRHFAVNLRAPALLSQAFAHALPDGHSGAIVNIVDQRVWKPTPRCFSYTLTKSALFTATRTMAQALAPRIRVNAVGPGPIFRSERQTPDDFRLQAAAVPLGHAVAPAEIADAVLYLARARSVTGQMIAVDGGQHLAWQTPDAVVAE